MDVWDRVIGRKRFGLRTWIAQAQKLSMPKIDNVIVRDDEGKREEARKEK
jgi:hypothetical protein